MPYRINYPSRGPFVHANLNLFSGSGESWHRNLAMEQNTAISSSTHSDFLEDIKCGHQNVDKRTESELQPVAVKEAKQDFSNKSPLKLVTVEEETEDKSTDSIKILSYKSVDDGGSTTEVRVLLELSLLFGLHLKCIGDAYISIVIKLCWLCY